MYIEFYKLAWCGIVEAFCAWLTVELVDGSELSIPGVSFLRLLKREQMLLVIKEIELTICIGNCKLIKGSRVFDFF